MLEAGESTLNINDLLGVPFDSNGKDPKVSLNCWGLVMEVMRRHGHIVPDYNIPAELTAQIMLAYTEDKNQWQREPGPAEGIVVALAIDPHMPGYVQHFGVCLGKSLFIHTLEKTNVIVTKFEHRYFAPKIKGFHRWIA